MLSNTDIIFRVDAFPEIGMGHLKRCYSLAKAFIKAGITPKWICKAKSQEYLKLIVGDAEIFTLKESPAESFDAKQTLEILKKFNSSVCLFVDSYNLNKAWELIVRKESSYLVVIDDICRAHSCDLLLNPSFACQNQPKGDESVQRLEGTDYVLIDEGVNCLKGNLKSSPPQIFVCYGGSDFTDETRKFIKAFQGKNIFPWYCNIVVGPAYAYDLDFASESSNMSILRDPANIKELMSVSTLSFGACGTMAYERCALGLPTIVTTTAENQFQTRDHLQSKGVIRYLGHYPLVTHDKIWQAFLDIKDDNTLLKKMSADATKVVDGEGCGRVVKKIFKVMT